MSDAWAFSALVARYGIEVEGHALEYGEFGLSLANWWLPLMGGHDARYLNCGIASRYDDSERGLVVDFVTADPWVEHSLFDGVPMEFSIGAGRHPALPFAELYEITVVRPGHVARCPGTHVLPGSFRPASSVELERVQWASRIPNGNPVHDASSIGEEIRLRYGIPRDVDDDTKAGLVADRLAAFASEQRLLDREHRPEAQSGTANVLTLAAFDTTAPAREAKLAPYSLLTHPIVTLDR